MQFVVWNVSVKILYFGVKIYDADNAIGYVIVSAPVHGFR
jgi:hypothetical protein